MFKEKEGNNLKILNKNIRMERILRMLIKKRRRRKSGEKC
jgi:hypothetical protein